VEEEVLPNDKYGLAVERAVGAHPEGAFVMETVFGKAALEQRYFGPNFNGRLGASPFLPWIADNAALTRLTTRLPATALTQDVAFTVPYRGRITNSLQISPAPAAPRPAHAGALFAVVLAAALRRQRRRRA
jgi:MYXO-CTERM domain-containing protein